MTEEEELRLALEESKKEAERVKLQATPQWSNAVRQTSSTHQSAPNSANGSNTTPVKPKVPPTSTPVVANSSPKVSLPARSLTNPWGTQSAGTPNSYSSVVASSKPTDNSSVSTGATQATIPQKTINSAVTPSNAAVAPPIAESSESTPRTHNDEEDAEFDDDEMVLAPVASRPAAAVSTPTPVKPIARPTPTTQSYSSNTDTYNSAPHASETQDSTSSGLENSRASSHNYDATSTATMSTSTLSSGLSSPVPQASSNVTQQLQEALSRIAKLEHDNQLIVNRMNRILEASVQLEQTVSMIATENAQLKLQVAELKTQVQTAVSTNSSNSSGNQATDPSANILSSHFYSSFYPMSAYGSQGMSNPYTSNPSHVNAPFTTNGYLG